MTTPSCQPSAYGRQMAKYFNVDQASTIIKGPSAKPQMVITRLISTHGLPERTASIPSEKAFVVSVHLTPASLRGCEVWTEDKYSNTKSWPSGGVGIYDLESNPRTRNPSAVDWVHYHIPRATLNAFTDDAGIPTVQSLRCVYGTLDRTLLQLTQLVMPSLNIPQMFSQLFMDYFRLIVCAHVVRQYAPISEPIVPSQGGLAPWQRRRVAELLQQHLDGELKLATLAEECELSISHFARSFRRSFGTSAHRYLIQQRIEMAKTLLSETCRPLSQIAVEAGFSDQAAFTRTFRSAVGAPPGRWKRENSRRKIFL